MKDNMVDPKCKSSFKHLLTMFSSKGRDFNEVIQPEEQMPRLTSKNSRTKNICLLAVFGIITIAIVGIIIGINKSSASYSNCVLNVHGVTYNMVEVQAGTFIMGATPEMEDPRGDEKPTHQVTLITNYYIGETEVTQALWEAVMGNNPSYFKGDDLPVECVSWIDCQKFISKLNSMTGQNFRLPTEAEWEFAARGGKNSNHYQYSGSNIIDDVAWYKNNSGSTTNGVATKLPNELGIYDMSGNVMEWCSDWYDKYNGSSQTDPQGPNNGATRVFRGGCWFTAERCNCTSYRYSFGHPGIKNRFLGFRLVLSQ